MRNLTSDLNSIQLTKSEGESQSFAARMSLPNVEARDVNIELNNLSG